MKNSIHASLPLFRLGCGPGWRWRLAQRIVEDTLPLDASHGDQLVRETSDYLALERSGDGAELLALRRHPRVHVAVTAWQDPLLQPRLKILIVGDTPQSEIAARLGIDDEIVQTIESLFYDVRELLSASAWLVCRVILPEEESGNTDLGMHLRAALFGGAAMAQAILDASERLPLAEADRLYDETLLLYVKLKQALALPLLSQENCLKFTQMFLDFRNRTEELALAREKFRHRCQQELRREQEAQPSSAPDTQEDVSRRDVPRVACSPRLASHSMSSQEVVQQDFA